LETDIIHCAWHRPGDHTGERSNPVVEVIVEAIVGPALKPKIGTTRAAFGILVMMMFVATTA